MPLLEVVSEPDIRSATEAVNYVKKLREILIYLGVNDGNMNEGSMRIDANVSVRPFGQEEFGTRSETKNVNSFKSLEMTRAQGLLKAEVRILGSLLMEAADGARIPGGAALIVDRAVFSATVSSTTAARSTD